MSSIKISIFTPTYNRAFSLHRVFDSLQKQTYRNFEWIVVDDGSTDNTEALIKEYKKNADFDIIYYWQKNQGKHVAINKGISLASGELFSIVDSDDYIISNALELFIYYYTKIKKDSTIAGLSFPIVTKSGEFLTKNFIQKELICNSFDLSYKFKISGEMAKVMKLEIMRNFPFPQFTNEKFCPESLIWKRIALSYKLYFINNPLYIGEYLEHGISSNYWENMKKSPQTAILYFTEMSNYKKIPLKIRLFTLENYWKFSNVNTSLSFFEKLKKVPFFLSIYVIIRIYFKSFLNKVKNKKS